MLPNHPDHAAGRIERDLHDGAQQRLVSLALRLRTAQAAMPPEFGAQLDHAITEAADALDELTEIARGIHPAILTERGLTPALKTLARRSPLTCRCRCMSGCRNRPKSAPTTSSPRR
jgi:signal transduction histidine kinase